MLHKCANPDCRNPFRNINQGKLFHISTEFFPAMPTDKAKQPQLSVEHYWLCEACTGILTLVADREKGLLVVPIATIVPGTEHPILNWGRRVNDGPDNLGENWEFRRNRNPR
jgi:hypothetical protein